MTHHNTRLFTISLWQAQQDDDPLTIQWRGKLQSLPDGEAYYFRDWAVLIAHLETMLTGRQGFQNESNAGGKEMK